MLKYKKEIEILESYLGVYAEHFEWVGIQGSDYTAEGKIGSFKTRISLTHNRDIVRLWFHPTKTGSAKKLCAVRIEDPNGPQVIEDRVGALIRALTPTKLDK